MTMDQTPPVIVVMVPFPAQGHLNSLLHLSRVVAARGLPVYFVGSATHNRQAKHRVQGWNPDDASNIHFQDLPIPPFATPPPDPTATIKFPSHLQPTFEAAMNLREPFAAVLASLCTTAGRVAIVHDPLMPFAAKESTLHPNSKAYAFHSCSAISTFFFTVEGADTQLRSKLIVPKMPNLSSEGCVTQQFIEFVTPTLSMLAFDAGNLYNTCRPIEGEFVDLLSQEPLIGNKKLWAVGPLNPVVLSGTQDQRSSLRHECLEWLDKQPPKSVLYVSFGTMTSISNEQIYEIAIGLEKSNQRFIWVFRDADIGDIFAVAEEGEEGKKKGQQLPENYEERIKGVGLIVRDWAPQLEILAHPSTGGFLSHCGWNSCMESISVGVPIAAWPMHSDQPMNGKLVSEILKIGVEIRDWARREEIVQSNTVESAVRKLMESEEGMEMRKRAEELGGAVRGAIEEGGTSQTDLDSFVAHISR
eukprot:TRINITY_DN284_c0_g1_i4.p1 TRINITY_DN284_c0_g1~~TRINITY_DN284_c0_g1_i4.p1  ORF type:complete len:473 (+),score=45.80 TRINITY_DN284_c0_g1_i4:171-1589(+)